MKKITMAIALCLVCAVNVFGQITLGNSGSSKLEDYLIKGRYYNIKSVDGVYFLNVKDLESTEFIRIKLGNASEARESLNTICDWFENAKTKDYVEFNVGDETITMYKYTSSVPYFSNGDVEYLKNYIQKMVMKGLFGTPSRKRVDDKMVGCVDSINQLKKVIDKIN